jgi:ketosteroid isomerase-like protein
MSTKDLVQSYYVSLNEKDEKGQELWSEDAVFSDASQTFDARGKEAVVRSFASLAQLIEKVSIKQLIVEENKACAIVNYDYINPKGGKFNQDVAEIWEIKNGKQARVSGKISQKTDAGSAGQDVLWPGA